ncbi:MAG: ATP-binding protein [Planctomycetaceae bacterium]|nr:ATP-binding protein [Planctomycetaceae bacterium]
MKKHGSIFTRFLVAGILPFAVVFVFAAVVLSDVIYTFNKRNLANTVRIFATNASEKITDTLDHINALLNLTSQNMADLAGESAHSEAAVLELLHTLMESNPEIFCAWYVFSEGVLNDNPGWQARSFLKRDGGINEIPAVKELDDPAISPWHYYPFRSATPYFDILDFWDYGIGEGYHYTGTLGHPVIRNGVVIGTVGMDILYEQAFRFMEKWQNSGGQRLLLISDNGLIVHSWRSEMNGSSLLDLPYQKQHWDQLRQALVDGTPLQMELRSPMTDTNSLVELVPVDIGDAEHRLHLYLEVDTDTLYRDLRGLMQTLALLSLLGVVFIVLATAYAARGVVTPINRLSHLAQGMADGSLVVDPQDLDDVGKSGMEVALLSKSLSTMLGSMEQNHQLKLAAMEAEYEKKRAEEMAKARTQFFATMSHELRTPMNAIVGIADILMAEDMPERQKGFVKDIKSSSESLLVIIDDILDVSRLDAGKLSLVPASFNLWRMLENVASLTEYLARDKNLVFTLHRDQGVPEYVVADEVRLRQILVNLLGNAVKFTPAGSVSLIVTAQGDELRFDVADTGIGIRGEDREALFDAFRQVDTTRNRKVKGTGLGLSISMSLARIMGGSLEVESEYGKGSTFRVRVPLVSGEPTRMIKPERPEKEGIRAGARVLVVDDNEINLRVARGLMGLFDLECDTAASGHEALDKVRDGGYDLVFMDHMMPEMDGVETTRRIRALGGLLSGVPIIAFTANSSAGVEAILLEAGMNDFLQKPIRKEALIRVLRRWLPETTPDAANDANDGAGAEELSG